MFAEQLEKEISKTTQLTENGAVGYSTTGKALLDLNFGIASFRSQSEDTILQKFTRAYYGEKNLSSAFLFFARDVREGLGERRFFRVCFNWLCENETDTAVKLIEFIKEYGRWDDILCALGTPAQSAAILEIKKQLVKDIADSSANRSISLLAKWLPSSNTSSEETRKNARIIYRALGWSEKGYRKVVASLRRHISIVETQMSKKHWGDIDYSAVPSVANIKYNDAFLRNDESRRREYLASLSKGETKINAGVLFPHDIVHKYAKGVCGGASVDATLEQLWKALPDMVAGNGNTIVVADGSGSMNSTIGNSGVTALEVANALSIYFAERCSGQFKDKYITFSLRPALVNLSKCNTLREKIRLARSYDECSNTNIEAVFDLILNTAVHNHLPQSEMPENILIISDMEFDSCACSNSTMSSWFYNSHTFDNTLMNCISERYNLANYKLPRLIFWNVNSRTGTVPIQENDCGVALVSGFSTNICKMVMSTEIDPYKCLLDQLTSDRYKPILEALN